MNKYWCNDKFGICYPLLKEVDMSIPISQQKGYNNEYGRYWTKPVLAINGRHYIICSQWFKGFQEKLDKWIENQELKQEIYVLPKPMRKTCPKCENVLIKNPLPVVYHTDVADINNMLPTQMCGKCKLYFLSEGIFGSYTRSKNLESISVKFIKEKL